MILVYHQEIGLYHALSKKRVENVGVTYMEYCMAEKAAVDGRKSFTATSLFSFFLSVLLLVKIKFISFQLMAVV